MQEPRWGPPHSQNFCRSKNCLGSVWEDVSRDLSRLLKQQGTKAGKQRGADGDGRNQYSYWMNQTRIVTNWTAFPSRQKLETGKQSHQFWAFWKQEDLKGSWVLFSCICCCSQISPSFHPRTGPALLSPLSRYNPG